MSEVEAASRRFAFFGGLTFATSAAQLAGGIGVSILLARWLGPEGKGGLTYLLAYPALLFGMGGLGFASATVYYVGQKQLSLRDAAANSLAVSLVLGTVLSGGLLIARPPGHQLWHGIPPTAVWMVLPLTVTLFVRRNLSRLLTAKFRFVRVNLINAIEVGALALSTVLLVAVVPLGLSGAVLASCGSAALALGMVLFALRRNVDLTVRLQPAVIGQCVRYGVLTWGLMLANFLNLRIDIFLINHYLGNREVGWYSIGVSFATLMWMLPQSLGIVLFPLITAGKRDEVNVRTQQVTRNSLLALAVVSVVLAAVGPWLIPAVYSEAFRNSVAPLWAILPGVTLYPVSHSLALDFAGRRRQGIPLAVSAGALVVNVVLNLLLLPRHEWYGGIVGAGLASSVSYTLMAAGMVILYTRRWHVPARNLLIPTRSDLQAYRRLLGRVPVFQKNDDGPEHP